MSPDKKDYSSGAFFVTAGVILILIGISFLPEFSIKDFPLNKTSIISDIVNDYDTKADSTSLNDNKIAEFPSFIDISDTAITVTPIDSIIKIIDGSPRDTISRKSANPGFEGKYVAVEDFGDQDKSMSNFYNALANSHNRPVHIAVLGDSFIEGDIFTADLREQLQEIYGGRGAGFVPFASNLAQHRATVKHSFNNWNISSVMNKKNITDDIKPRFSISGLVCQPFEGATLRIEGVSYRKYLKTASTARLIFTNEKNTVIDITINDTITKQYTPQSSNSVQQIVITGNINSINAKFTSTEGFWGYGIGLEDSKGVTVDNYSIRGNSGFALLQTNSQINKQINALTGYDLIILQYGINAMNPNEVHYTSYSHKLVNIINYIKSCFPHSSIMVMSVGDRCSRNESGFSTMPAVGGMIKAQREAAKATKVAFWNTYEGMGGYNSMIRFVDNKWAAKDYTHISYAGGRYIATELVKAIVNGQDTHSNTIAQPESPLNKDTMGSMQSQNTEPR